jgi:hypothetical protein
MNMNSPFLNLDCCCDKAMQWSSQKLTQNGLRVMQTFDLQAARHALENCPCPHHGTDKCDCQMVVLLVYGKAGGSVTLILHGNDGKTSLSLVNNSLQHADPAIQSAVEQALQQDLSR